jgi:hypothetical protein
MQIYFLWNKVNETLTVNYCKLDEVVGTGVNMTCTPTPTPTPRTHFPKERCRQADNNSMACKVLGVVAG